MVQGDEYSLPITIKDVNGRKITPSEVEGIKVKIGDYVDSYPNGALTYDPDTEKWLFPLTQEQTLSMKCVKCQVQVKFITGDIFGSVPQVKQIAESIIKDRWT